jgi:hypothetical protein
MHPASTRSLSCVDRFSGGANRLSGLQDAHRAAFAAFTRPQGEADRRGAIVVASPSIGPTGNPALNRRVYEGPAGTIDLVPGLNSIACVVIRSSGESFSGATSIELAIKDGCGYMRQTRSPDAPQRDELILMGVLPAGAARLHVTTGSGGTIPVPLTADGAYWIATRDLQDLYWTRPDGEIHHHTFVRLHMGRMLKSE